MKQIISNITMMTAFLLATTVETYAQTKCSRTSKQCTYTCKAKDPADSPHKKKNIEKCYSKDKAENCANGTCEKECNNTCNNNKNNDADSIYAIELLKPGCQMPSFKLKNPDGKVLNSENLKGKYIVLDFWASWCPDCRKDLPNIIKLYNDFHKKGVEFVGISFDTDVNLWKNCIEKYHIPYIQVSELKKFHDTNISKTFGVKWIPSMYLIDKNGKVVLGTVLSEKLRKVLEKLLP